MSNCDKCGMPSEPILHVRQKLYGYCGGFFGRDSMGDKIIEAMGTDWVVVRDGPLEFPEFYSGDLSKLLEFTEKK